MHHIHPAGIGIDRNADFQIADERVVAHEGVLAIAADRVPPAQDDLLQREEVIVRKLKRGLGQQLDAMPRKLPDVLRLAEPGEEPPVGGLGGTVRTGGAQHADAHGEAGEERQDRLARAVRPLLREPQGGDTERAGRRARDEGKGLTQ